MEKKLHRALAEAVVGILRSVFEEGAVADREVGRVLGAHPKWGRRDRSLVAETVYEVVRWRRRLEVLAGSGEWWDLAGYWWEGQGFGRPDWAGWEPVDSAVRAEREAQLESHSRAVRLSLSDELDALGEAELGSGPWEAEAQAMNRAAPVFLRVNPKRGSVASVIAELLELGVEVRAVDGCPSGLEVIGGKGLSPQMRSSGRFEIQDAGSQQVAPFCQVQPCHRVIDYCAGAGGKTLHLAALMEGSGDLLAMDVQERKLETLKARATRATVRIRTALHSPEVLARNLATADRVLADAPCSGSGTLRRQADLKYRITPENVEALQAIQREVLEGASSLVKPGGKLIYATCSILTSENEAQTQWFSAANPNFVLEEERRISPAASGWDGFYMVRWNRVT